jgi:ferredoxin-NADP reductase
MDETVVTVKDSRDVGTDAVALDIETPAGFDAQPGQFVKLILTLDGEAESRFYTLSSPRVSETFEITVGIDPDGDVSPKLRGLAAGDEVHIAGPYGNAYYEGESNVCLLAGGPGVGPAVGIAERVLQEGGDAAVVYRDDAPIHEPRLDALEADGAFVETLDEDDELTDAVERAVESGIGGIQVFVYGFADFLDDAMGAIEAAGGDPDRAKIENFG